MPISRRRPRLPLRFHPQLAVALALALTLAFAARGDADTGSRFQRLGSRLICSCGCTQGALVCNHVGCPVVTKMRSELAARSVSTDSDELVLQSFVQEYGAQVIAVPSTRGFNLLAWVMPWIAAGLGLALVLAVVKQWHRRDDAGETPGKAPDGDDVDSAVAGVRLEVEAELRREWRH